MVIRSALQSLTSTVERSMERRSRGASLRVLFRRATNERNIQRYASLLEARPQDADPLAELGRIIGRMEQHDPIAPGRSREYPSVRQIPFAYDTEDFGPVYAFGLTDDGKKAKCCTWDDYPVELTHDELLPFNPNVMGADEIKKLDRDIDIGGPTGKYPKPRETTIGEWFIRQPIFFNSLSE